jgi:hypothetical protein
VSVEKGALTVRAAKKDLSQTRRVKPLCARDKSNSQTIVVVGGGAAAEVRQPQLAFIAPRRSICRN